MTDGDCAQRQGLLAIVDAVQERTGRDVQFRHLAKGAVGAIPEDVHGSPDRLPERAELHGPAIVEEFGATTVVLPGWRGAVDTLGNLVFEREGAA